MGWGELLLRPLPLPALWASGKSCLGACAAAAVPAVRKTETFKPCYLPDICPGVGLNLKKYVLVAQLCLTLCDPMNYRPPGSSVHGILQARILEWVVVKVTQSCLTLVTPWTVACKVPLSMGFSRQEYWSGLPFPSSGDLSDPEIEPRSPALQAESLPTELGGKPYHPSHQGNHWKRIEMYIYIYIYITLLHT